MLQPPIPDDDRERVESLRLLDVLDTPAEDRFERITRLAKRLFHARYAAVSLVDADRQWFKSCQGLAVNETSRAVSFCGHAILENEPFIVPDALQDSRFADNPLVTGAPHIRFYAGIPVSSPDGHRVGTLCVLCAEPRAAVTGEDIDTLRDLAALVEAELRVRRLSEAQSRLIADLGRERRRALTDGLTRVWNRKGIRSVLEAEMSDLRDNDRLLGIVILDIDRFKSINDEHGHAVGDTVLRECSGRLLSALREPDALGRYGGEEFLVLLPDAGLDHSAEIAERMRHRLAAAPIIVDGEVAIAVTASFGVAVIQPSDLEQATTPAALADATIAAADEALYRAKNGGRNRVELAEALVGPVAPAAPADAAA